MEEQSEIVRSKKEFAFASSTILSQVGRGIIVGLIVGIIVGSFRFLIEKGFHMIQGVYQDQGYLVRNLFVLVLFYILICWLSAKLTRSEKDIKGSGIPQVEAELKGLMSLNWWGILWKKYVLGILAIASGLMLGREGPSIQHSVLFVGLSVFITLKNSYNIFLKNYNFLEKYTSLCYTTSILTYGENT